MMNDVKPPPAGHSRATNKYDIFARKDADLCAAFADAAQRALAYGEVWLREDGVTAEVLSGARQAVRKHYLRMLHGLEDDVRRLSPLHTDYKANFEAVAERALALRTAGERLLLSGGRHDDACGGMADEIWRMAYGLCVSCGGDVDFESELAEYMASEAFAADMRGLRSCLRTTEGAFRHEVAVRLAEMGAPPTLLEQWHSFTMDAKLNDWGARLLAGGGARRLIQGLWVTGAMREWQRANCRRRYSDSEIEAAQRSTVQMLNDRHVKLNRWHVLGMWFAMSWLEARRAASFADFARELESKRILNVAGKPMVDKLYADGTRRRSTDRYFTDSPPSLWDYDAWILCSPTQDELRLKKRPLKTLDELLDMKTTAELMTSRLA